MASKIKSIGISGILTLNAHDLNNEGNEGNITIARTASIVIDGNVKNVNAISGDMLKHSVSTYINEIAKADGLNLCAGCAVNHANRINMDERLKPGTDEEMVNNVLKICAGDDVNGFMVTKKGINIKRKSCYESGMVIGIPDRVVTERDFHAKYSRESAKPVKKHDADADGSNIGQNIFYRPNNSGDYATVMFVNVDHIGRNGYTHKYAIGEEERQRRVKVLLTAIASTYTNIRGAQRNTMMPHTTGFAGVVSISWKSIPAPTVSPLNGIYKDELKGIAENMNKMSAEAIELREFNTLTEFTQIIASI